MMWTFLVAVCHAQAPYTWQEWSDTDVSALWRQAPQPEARSRVKPSESGGAAVSLPLHMPEARLAPELALVYDAGVDDIHLAHG